MKKLTSIILLAMAIFLVVPVSSAFAYTDGLLNGNWVNRGVNGNITNVTDNKTKYVTDGILTNYETLSYATTTGSNTMWVDIPSSTIDSYQLKINYLSVPKDAIYLKLYDGSGNVLYSTNTLNGSDVKVKFTPVPNVQKVVLINTNVSNGAYVYEFDVFSATTPPPAVPTGLSATGGNSKVDLQWTTVTDATGYNVKRSTTTGGPYTTIATSVTGTTYTDTAVTNGTKYYYVVTAVNSGGESSNSNEASATPTAPALTRALLVITLVNGLEKEYDLSMTDVNSFISWYNGRATGTGSEVYTFNKNYNLASFLSRKDYIAYSKIETFEVNEYKVTTP